MNNKKLGEFGERIAINYLKTRGFIILHKNWTCRWGELDIVTRHKEIIVFVEVKYRTNLSFGTPSDSITSKKLKSLKNSMWRYLLIHNLFHKECRLDVICVTLQGKKAKLKHYKSVSF